MGGGFTLPPIKHTCALCRKKIVHIKGSMHTLPYPGI